MQRMCGVRYDKPEVMSEDRFFRVIFKSNTEYDATGFKAVYTFIKNKGIYSQTQAVGLFITYDVRPF